MSRIGRLPVSIPKGVKIDIKNNEIAVKGPKGALSTKLNEGFNAVIENDSLSLTRPSEQKSHKSLHGLYRKLIDNMVVGVSNGFTTELELVGVGYRAEAKGQVIELSLGFSHQLFFVCPPEVNVQTVSEKGKNPRILLQSIDKQLLGQVAAKIRSQRPPEPYKGKGVRYSNEQVRRKAGKSSGKGKK